MPSGRITNITPARILNDPLFSSTLHLPVPAKGETWDLPDTVPSTGPDTALQSLAADLVLSFSTVASTSSEAGDQMTLQYAQASASITGSWELLPGLVLEKLNFAVLMYAPTTASGTAKTVEVHLGGLFTFTPTSSTGPASLQVTASFEKTSSSRFFASISAESSTSTSDDGQEKKALGMTPNTLLALPEFGAQPLTQAETEAGELVIPSAFPVQESDLVAATTISCEIDVLKTTNAVGYATPEWKLSSMLFLLSATPTQAVDLLPGVLSLSSISLLLIFKNDLASVTLSRSIMFTADATMKLGVLLTLLTRIEFFQKKKQKVLRFLAIAAPQDVNLAVQALTLQPLSSLLPDGAPPLVGSGSTVLLLAFGFTCIGSIGSDNASESFLLSEIWVSFDPAQIWTIGPLSLTSLSASISWSASSSSSRGQVKGNATSVQLSATAVIGNIPTMLDILYLPSSGTSSGETLSFSVLATNHLYLKDLISLGNTSTVPVPEAEPRECPDFGLIPLASLTGMLSRPQPTPETPNPSFALTTFDAAVHSSTSINIMPITPDLSLVLQKLSFLWTYHVGATPPNKASIYALLELGPATLQLVYSQDSNKNDVYAGVLAVGSSPAEYDSILSSLLPGTAYAIDQDLNAPPASALPMAAVAAVVTRNVGAKISAQASGGTSNPWTLPFEKVTLALDSVGIDVQVGTNLFLVRIDVARAGVTITNTLHEDINWWFMTLHKPSLSISSHSSTGTGPSFTIATDASFFDFDTTIKTSITYIPPASDKEYPTYEAMLVLPDPFPSVSLLWSDGAFGIGGWNFQPYWGEVLRTRGIGKLEDAIREASKPTGSCTCEEMVDLIFEDVVKTKFNFSLGKPKKGTKLLDVDDKGNATLNGSLHITIDIVINLAESEASGIETTEPPLIKDLDIGTWPVSLTGPFKKDELFAMFLNTVRNNFVQLGKAILEDGSKPIAKLTTFILTKDLTRKLVKSLLCRDVNEKRVVDAGNNQVGSDQDVAFEDVVKVVSKLVSAIKTAIDIGIGIGCALFFGFLVVLGIAGAVGKEISKLMNDLYEDGGLGKLLTSLENNEKRDNLLARQKEILDALATAEARKAELIQHMQEAMALKGVPSLTLNDPPLVPSLETLLVDWTNVVPNSLKPDPSEQPPPELSSLVWNVLVGTTSDPTVAKQVATVAYPATTALLNTSAFTAGTLHVWVRVNLVSSDKTSVTAVPGPVATLDFVPRASAPTSVVFVTEGLSTASTMVQINVEGVENGGTYGLYVVPAGITTIDSPLFSQSMVVSTSATNPTFSQLSFPLFALRAIPSGVTGLSVLVQHASTDNTKFRPSAICASSQSVSLQQHGDFSQFQSWTTNEPSSTAVLQWSQPQGQAVAFDIVMLDSLTSKTPITCTQAPVPGASAVELVFAELLQSQATLFFAIRQRVIPAQSGMVVPYLLAQASVTHQPAPTASGISYDAATHILSLIVSLGTVPLFLSQTVMLALQPSGTTVPCHLAPQNPPQFPTGVPVAVTASLAKVDKNVVSSTQSICVALQTPGPKEGQPTLGPWSPSLLFPQVPAALNISMAMMTLSEENTIRFSWLPPKLPAGSSCKIVFVPTPNTSRSALEPIVTPADPGTILLSSSQLGSKRWSKVSFLQTTYYSIPGVTDSTVSQTFVFYRAPITALTRPPDGNRNNFITLSTRETAVIANESSLIWVNGSDQNLQYFSVLFSGETTLGAVTIDTQAKRYEDASTWAATIPNAQTSKYGSKMASYYSKGKLFIFWASAVDMAVRFVSTTTTPAQRSGNPGTWTSEAVAPFNKEGDASIEKGGAIAALDNSEIPFMIWQAPNYNLLIAWERRDNGGWTHGTLLAHEDRRIVSLIVVKLLEPPNAVSPRPVNPAEGPVFGGLAAWSTEAGRLMLQVVGSGREPEAIPTGDLAPGELAIHQTLDSDGSVVVLVFYTDSYELGCSIGRMNGSATPPPWTTIRVATQNYAHDSSPIRIFRPSMSGSKETFLVVWYDSWGGMMVAVPSMVVDGQTGRKSLAFSVQTFPNLSRGTVDPGGLRMNMSVAVAKGKPTMWMIFPASGNGTFFGMPFTCGLLQEIQVPDIDGRREDSR